jgi:RNA polymerase sigma factor (sigma-70 family)
MASRQQRGGVLQDVRTLFDSGTTVGLTDGELLGRFADRAERAGERDDPAGPAFAALLERHGPMVLRVCRSILGDEHDAQDAFQATFLVLVRRARAVRRRDSVGSWLHGVALRVSARARADQARRRRHERRAGAARDAADRSGSGAIAPELASALHEELGRLPERYCAAVVLCYLEGHTCEAAARRLGWPVGTVKSRLARGRERLRGRLIRRGLAPDEPTATAVLLPATLSRTTVEAMLRFATGMPADGAVSATALSWTFRTLRTMRMTRLALISALLIAGLAATGAAMLTARGEEPAQPRSAAPAKRMVERPEPARPAATERFTKFSVRVIDTKGRGVPGVEVKLIEVDAVPGDDGPGSRTAAYRTAADGRVRTAVDPRFHRLMFEARPDDGTFGWASLGSGDAWLKAHDESPITLTLLSRNYQVEGTIVNTQGKQIGGVQVRAVQFNHEANGSTSGFRHGDEEPWLASGVTDKAGRYRLSLPEATSVLFGAYHPRYVGPWFSWGPDDRTIAAVTMEDAGGIAGTVIDAATSRPVAGARISAGCIEITERILGGGGGRAVSDDQGHFLVGGLAPGVYNLEFRSSPKGRRFTARAVEGVRVQAGRDARADLRMIEGRRLHGTAVFAATGEPVVGGNIACYNASGGQWTYTDEQGRFEHFVPPGLALVYLNPDGTGPGSAARKTLRVPDDRDSEPVILKRGYDPTAGPAPSPRPSRPIECEVRVRVKIDPGDRPAPGGDHTLTGRIFDKDGSPLPAIRIDALHGRKHFGAATDRLGLFRLPGLPRGRLELGLRRDGDHFGRAIIPAEAVEVDLILPEPPGREE